MKHCSPFECNYLLKALPQRIFTYHVTAFIVIIINNIYLLESPIYNFSFPHKKKLIVAINYKVQVAFRLPSSSIMCGEITKFYMRIDGNTRSWISPIRIKASILHARMHIIDDTWRWQQFHIYSQYSFGISTVRKMRSIRHCCLIERKTWARKRRKARKSNCSVPAFPIDTE